MMGSEVATGKVAQVWTVLATLVPSTRTCSTVRCSLSVATITTESSGMTDAHSKFIAYSQGNHLPEGLDPPFLPSNFSLSKKGCGFLGPSGDSALGETR